jgi:hypothetical protein
MLLVPLLSCLIVSAASAKNVTVCRVFEREAVRRIEHDAVLKDGAIAISYGDNRVVNPYFSNLIALSLVGQPKGSDIVMHWMQWYVRHINWPDEDRLFGTVDDYKVEMNGRETSLGKADSRDSYAGTFLSVSKALFENGNASQRSYVALLKYQEDLIGGVIVQEQQADGLTWALPGKHVKYLLDNCEAYRGLADLSFLMKVVYKDRKAADYFAERAAEIRSGIQREFWDPVTKRYFVAKLEDGTKISPKLDTWAPDAYVQMGPLIEGVLAPSDRRALLLYEDITRRFPGWPRRRGDTLQAYAAVGYAGALLGDRFRSEELVGSLGSARSYSQSVRAGNIAEQAWLVRACRAPSMGYGRRV